MVNFFYLDKDPKKCAQYYCNKHVLKIPIEIAQILSKIHHEIKSGIDCNRIYGNSAVVKNTLGPYCWIHDSYDNYIWTAQLGLELINEYKLRYNKNNHKTEVILKHLAENPPKLPKIGITKFIGTNKYDMFQFISKDPIICARYNYAEMKCNNDKWNVHGPPEWFEQLRKHILFHKKKLIHEIDKQVREVLPSLVGKGDTVHRFHSFLRVSYDHLFQGKWDVKAKLMNKYDKDKPLIHQLTYPQLYYVYEITKSLENKKTLFKLNIESLKYRNKLKFPQNNINYRDNPNYYINNYKIKDIFEIQPYSNEINKVIDNSSKIHDLYVKYIKNNDLIGVDVIYKYCQVKKFNKLLQIISSDENYIKWINTFNWKIANPYQPKNYLLL